MLYKAMGNIRNKKYDFIREFNHEGIAVVRIGDKYGFVDTDGYEVTPIKYDFIGSFDIFNEGRTTVKHNDKWGFINSSGVEITQIKYDITYPFIAGKGYMKIYDILGEVDINGKEYFTVENLAELRKKKLKGIIDEKEDGSSYKRKI